MRTPLDCPFCANSDLTVIVVDHDPPTLDVHCPECGAIGPRSVSDDPAHVLPNHDHSHCTQRYRNCLACLGLVRMNPCGASRQTHRDRNRARDVGTSQTRFQREPRHRSQVLRGDIGVGRRHCVAHPVKRRLVRPGVQLRDARENDLRYRCYERNLVPAVAETINESPTDAGKRYCDHFH